MWLVVLMGTARPVAEEAYLAAEKIRLELALMVLNFRMRRIQLRLYKQPAGRQGDRPARTSALQVRAYPGARQVIPSIAGPGS